MGQTISISLTKLVILLVLAGFIGYIIHPEPIKVTLNSELLAETSELNRRTLKEIKEAQQYVLLGGDQVLDSVYYYRNVIPQDIRVQYQAKYMLNAKSIQEMYPWKVHPSMAYRDKKENIDEIFDNDENSRKYIHSKKVVYAR
jgi:hypothetical protein